MKTIDEMLASPDRSPLLRHDTAPAESEPVEDCTPMDCTPPVVEPESVAGAVIVTCCIFGGFVVAVVAWVLS